MKTEFHHDRIRGSAAATGSKAELLKPHQCSIQDASGFTQAVTAPTAKRARTAASGWNSTAWTTSRTSVYLNEGK